jgi:uncharacterized protein YggE
MPYTQQTWQDNATVLDAARMQHIEDGIAAAQALAEAAAASNVHMQPVWDGTGAHPTRVMPVGAGFEIWRQPTFPQVGATFSQPGDEFEATQ